MQSQHNHRPLLNHRAAAASAVLPRQDVVSRPPQPLWLAITKLVILEFFVVAGAAPPGWGPFHQGEVGGGPSTPFFRSAKISPPAPARIRRLRVCSFQSGQVPLAPPVLFSRFVGP